MTWSRPHGWKVAEPGCIPGTVWPQSTHFNYNAISVLWPGMSATPASSLNEPLFVPHASALWASCTSWTLTLCFMPVCSGTWIPLLECHLPFVYLLECLIFQDSAQVLTPPWTFSGRNDHSFPLCITVLYLCFHYSNHNTQISMTLSS